MAERNTDGTLGIVFVSPSRESRNGIGDYSARLAGELGRLDTRCIVTCAADLLSRPALPRPGGDWRGREFPPRWAGPLLDALDESRPRLVHVQHGLYIGSGRELARFLDGLRERGIASVVTLHGIWPATSLRRWPARLYRLLADSAGRVIIHQEAGALKTLLGHGIAAERVVVIPHGTRSVDGTARVGTREAAGDRIVLFAGNIFRRKGLHVVLRAFPEVVRRVPRARLLVVGNERTNNLLDRLYLLFLHARLRRGAREGWLLHRQGYVPDPVFAAGIATATVAVFPYSRRYGSASGVFHHVLAAGRPALCSAVPTFAEAIAAWGRSLPELIVPPRNTGAWSRSLVRILSDDAFRERATAASRELGLRSSWAEVARLHLRLYRRLLAETEVRQERPAASARCAGGE
jgi:glycosyltransferase involved in cell wall biosynthesis